MFTLKTKDKYEVYVTYSNINPDRPKGGQTPATTYLWFKLENEWLRSKNRSAIELRNIIENNTLLELKNKETIL